MRSSGQLRFHEQVTADTVDAGIHALAEKKLKLDAAVLDGLAASAKQTKADENAGMTELLQTVLTGEHTCMLPPSLVWLSASHAVWLAERISMCTTILSACTAVQLSGKSKFTI